MADSTFRLPTTAAPVAASMPPSNLQSAEGMLENPIPPYQKAYKITALSIFRHIIYWILAALIIFLIAKSSHTQNEASAITFISTLVLFIIFNIGYWIASRFYDISDKCYDPNLLSQTEMDRIERELSEVKERLNQAKDIFNAAETPEAQEEARNRMTELYVAKQTLSKTYSQQAIIRPKLMFLIVYGTPYVRIATNNDLEAAQVAHPSIQATVPITPQQQASSSVANNQPSTSGTKSQSSVVVEESSNHESVYGSTIALCEKRKDSDNSDTNVY